MKAPTFKWGITLANIADFKRPAEHVSYAQQTAVTATGLIWSRFSTQITPVSVALCGGPRLAGCRAGSLVVMLLSGFSCRASRSQ